MRRLSNAVANYLPQAARLARQLPEDRCRAPAPSRVKAEQDQGVRHRRMRRGKPYTGELTFKIFALST